MGFFVESLKFLQVGQTVKIIGPCVQHVLPTHAERGSNQNLFFPFFKKASF